MTFSAFVVLAITAVYFLFGAGMLIYLAWKSKSRSPEAFSDGKEARH